MKRPTKAQLSIMERMAKGHPINVEYYGRLSIVTPGGRMTNTVLPVTLAVMIREGWAELVGDRRYVLTDAGRAALATETEQPGAGGGGR